jgi:N-acetylglutamate synthase-like GNAT family acetyltransferase
MVNKTNTFSFRNATPDDIPALKELIALSARVLGQPDYTEAQIEAALGNAWGVDSELVRDGTYFVVEAEGQMVGCGGWSRRQTLFGGDGRPDRQSALLDPTRDAARIRAFFIHPDWARQGIGKALLERCEAEARAHGFQAVELMATLPGQRLYQAYGYTGTAPFDYPLGESGLSITFVPLRKEL